MHRLSRAGEAGAGFAVVADEVRSLSMRAAAAAKETVAQLEETDAKINGGGTIVKVTNAAFFRVAESSLKVGELVAEIAEASMEQSDGVAQVVGAMAEMDKITQGNAASAEKSANSAQELSMQASRMKSYVDDLAVMIGRDRALVSSR